LLIYYSKNLFVWAKSENLRLTGRRARHFAADGAPAPLEKHWTALRAARSDFGKIENSLLMARLYNEARTHFRQNV
jgi:hypothetical protein